MPSADLQHSESLRPSGPVDQVTEGKHCAEATSEIELPDIGQHLLTLNMGEHRGRVVNGDHLVAGCRDRIARAPRPRTKVKYRRADRQDRTDPAQVGFGRKCQVHVDGRTVRSNIIHQDILAAIALCANGL